MTALCRIAVAGIVFGAASALAAPSAKKPSAPLPPPTHGAVAYGTHPRQVLDVWLPGDAAAPAPVIVFIHGGGFTKGDRKDSRLGARIPKCRAADVALVSVEYRLLKDAGDVKPPVRACMEDVMAAIRFVRAKAAEWKLDVAHMGLTGSSAGGCAALYAALAGGNEFGIRAVYAQYPQTSLDPQEMRDWIPNSRYGGPLFGYPDFQTWLDHRADVLPWIEKYSAAGLLRRCPPEKAPVFLYSGGKTPPPGTLAKDPTHSGVFCEKFREIAAARGIVCRRATHDDLIDILTGAQAPSQGSKKGKD